MLGLLKKKTYKYRKIALNISWKRIQNTKITDKSFNYSVSYQPHPIQCYTRVPWQRTFLRHAGLPITEQFEGSDVDKSNVIFFWTFPTRHSRFRQVEVLKISGPLSDSSHQHRYATHIVRSASRLTWNTFPRTHACAHAHMSFTLITLLQWFLRTMWVMLKSVYPYWRRRIGRRARRCGRHYSILLWNSDGTEKKKKNSKTFVKNM